MLKKLTPFMFLLGGIAGAFVRREQLLNGFDEKGLEKPGFGASVVLMLLCASAVILAVLFALRCTDLKRDCVGAFRMSDGACAIYAAFALIIALAAPFTAGEPLLSVSSILKILAVFSSAALIFFALEMRRGKVGGGLSAACAVPPLFGCFLMAVLYKENSGNPTLLEFAFEALATAATAISFYYTEGFVCGRARPRAALAANLMAVFFLPIAFAGKVMPAGRIVTAAFAAISMMNALLMLRDAPAAEALSPDSSDTASNED